MLGVSCFCSRQSGLSAGQACRFDLERGDGAKALADCRWEVAEAENELEKKMKERHGAGTIISVSWSALR